MKLLKNIIGVAFSNIASFGTSFIIGFILPAILSVADYGYYREYTLYLSFAYLFNLGFNDGIYIKYGGKDQEELSEEVVNSEHNFVMIFQLIVMGLMLIYSIIQGNMVLALFSIATFFVSMNTYHQNFLQATGEFSVYSKGNIYKSVFYVAILLVATLLLQSDNYAFYIALNVLSLVFIFVFYEWHRYKQYGLPKNVSTKNKGTIFRIGIFVLIANMSLTFVGNVGNWVVNFGFSIEEFAQYSFQNSVLNVMLLIINAVGMVFYNVISKHENRSILRVIKELSLLLGIFGGAAFFIFAFIIEVFLPDYVPAIPLLSMTFIAIPYIMISKILIANVYKSKRSETKYFRDSLLFAVFSFLLVGGVFLITNSMTAIALATTFCYIFWYIYTSRIEFHYLSGGSREFILLASHVVWFYITSNIFSIRIGFIAYLVYLGIILFMYKDRMKEIVTEHLITE